MTAHGDNKPRRRRRIIRSRAFHAWLHPKHRYALIDLAWLRGGLTYTELRVLGILCSHGDADRGTCFPSHETIRRESGIRDDAQVRRALRSLERKGVIQRTQRRRTSNLYWISPPDFCNDVAQHDANLTRGQSSRGKTTRNDTPRDESAPEDTSRVEQTHDVSSQGDSTQDGSPRADESRDELP